MCVCMHMFVLRMWRLLVGPIVSYDEGRQQEVLLLLAEEGRTTPSYVTSVEARPDYIYTCRAGMVLSGLGFGLLLLGASRVERQPDIHRQELQASVQMHFVARSALLPAQIPGQSRQTSIGNESSSVREHAHEVTK